VFAAKHTAVLYEKSRLARPNQSQLTEWARLASMQRHIGSMQKSEAFLPSSEEVGCEDEQLLLPPT